MVRRSSLVALLSAAGCFAEPSFESSATSDGTSSQGTTTNEIEVSGTSPDSSSTGPTGPSGGVSSESTDDCPAGSIGCPCQQENCEGDARCIEGICELTIPDGCGDGEEVDPESCDDGNNDPGDGCSPTCTFERECFLAHLGGPGETSIVRAYSVFPDGTMLEFADHGVPEHNPPLSGPGSELSRAAVSCAGQVYVASSAEGQITALRTTREGVTMADQADVPGVRELACDPGPGLLFAIRFVPNGFAISTFDVSAGTLVQAASDAYTEASILEMRAARLSLDRGSQRALVSFVEESAASDPVLFVRASYDSNSLTLGTPSMLNAALRNDLGALLHVGPANEVLGIGVGTGDQSDPAVYRLPLTDDGFGNIAVQEGPPWADRRNIWPLRLPGGEIGFALGGAQGVVLAHYPAGDDIEMIGEPVATTLNNTFARTAFDDTMLIVASPGRFETYDLTQREGKGQWPMLSGLAAPATETFASGAVVACP